MAELKRTMFREYDIRGQVKDELTDGAVGFIAKAFGSMLHDAGITECVVGYDNRSYSKGLAQTAMAGLVSTGIHVKNIGEVTAPVAYWSQYHLGVKGICMGTASHNPNGWFGLKLGTDFSSTLNGFDDLYGRILREDFVVAEGTREDLSTQDIIEAYQKDLNTRAILHRPMKIVVNCGNGAAGPTNVAALRQFGCEVVEQNTTPDATFPNHEPNPSSMGFQQAIEAKVKEVGADCGIGFDADGDRLGVTDNLGRTMYPDKILIFLARLALVNEPGASIVYDVKSTRAVADDVKAHGGVPVMWKTGHSHIKIKAVEVDAPVSGERSGHIFIRRGYYGFDDGLFAAMKFLEFVSSQEKTVAELHDEVSLYVSSPTYEAHCADEIKYQVVDKMVEALKKQYGAENVIDVNGARVEFADGWGLVRASSNLPKLVFVFEAKTKERMEEIKNNFVTFIATYPEVGEMNAE